MVIKGVLLGDGGRGGGWGEGGISVSWTIGQQQSINNQESKFQMTQVSHVGPESGHAKKINK